MEGKWSIPGSVNFSRSRRLWPRRRRQPDDENGPLYQRLCISARRVRRPGSDSPRFAAPAYAADVAYERAGRDRRGRSDSPRRRAQDHALHCPRHHRHRGRHQQRCGRLLHHRPHAQNVQGEPQPETMTPFPGTDTIIELTYLIATALFVMSLKWMSSPTTARHGVWAGEAGMLLAIVGTLLNRNIVDYKWVAIALVLGTIIGVPLGKVQMTAVPQRTALSHAFGACCVTLVGTAEFYLRAPSVPKFMMSVLSMED